MKKTDIKLAKLFPSLIFIGCLIVVMSRGYACFKKYLKRPESVEIAYKLSGGENFPSLTFCPLKYDEGIDQCMPKPFNVSILDYCKIDIEDYIFNGIWTSNKTNCLNPDELLNQLTPTLDGFGIKMIEVQTNNRIYKLDLDDER